MTETEVREWLNRGYRLDVEINALLEERSKSLLKATNTTTGLSDAKVQTSKQNTTEERFVEYAAYSEMINKRIDELYAIKREILELINQVTDNAQRAVLIMRYVKFEKWEQIALTMNYADQWVHVLHKRSLKSLKEILKNSGKF